MCGIIGSFSFTPNGRERQRIKAGLRAMQHRGPDGEGLLDFPTREGDLILGHNRLAIIDLSDAGRQPMVSRCGRYAMTFNGEIYNYIELRNELVQQGVAFHTETDSEVLLAAWARWGTDCLTRLDGMFAFVVFDQQEQTLHCVNDPFGIKPFYYSFDEAGFRFASEIPALSELQQGRPTLNTQKAVSFLLWGEHDIGDETFVSNVLRLKPGHILKYQLSRRYTPQIRRWWNPPLDRNDHLSFADSAESLRSIFLSSVQRQLRSDVPIGFALSGGVDSSAIVCAVRHLEPDYPIHTFSYIASKAHLNERKWADIVNTHVGANAHYIHDTDDDFDLNAAMQSQGEPFGSTSILAGLHVFQRMKAGGIVVSLDGQGADEALAGYVGYPQAVLGDYLDRRDFGGAIRFLNAWSRWPGRGKGAVARILGDMFVPDRLRAGAIRLAGYDPAPPWLKTEVLEDAGITFGVPAALALQPQNKGRRLAERLMVALTEVGLPRLLRYADRNSMHFSIESRVPFLSPALSAFMLTMPDQYLVSANGESKHLFREAMRGIVPDPILARRDKIGFETPELDLLLANRSLVTDWLAAAEDIPFLDSGEVRKVVNAYLDREIPYKSRCWRLINFCRWHSLARVSP